MLLICPVSRGNVAADPCLGIYLVVTTTFLELFFTRAMYCFTRWMCKIVGPVERRSDLCGVLQ